MLAQPQRPNKQRPKWLQRWHAEVKALFIGIQVPQDIPLTPRNVDAPNGAQVPGAPAADLNGNAIIFPAEKTISGHRAFKILGDRYLVPTLDPTSMPEWEKWLELGPELEEDLDAFVHGLWAEKMFMMVGTTEEDLKPTVVIFAWNSELCKTDAGKKRLRRRILKLAKRFQSLNGEDPLPWDVAIERNVNFTILGNNLYAWNISEDIEISASERSETLCGRLIRKAGGVSSDTAECTLGGLIKLRDEIYGITAAHPFMQAPKYPTKPQSSQRKLRDPAPSSDNDSDESDGSDHQLPITLEDQERLPSATASAMTNRTAQAARTSLELSLQGPEQSSTIQTWNVRGKALVWSAQDPSSDRRPVADWALATITDSRFLRPNRFQSPDDGRTIFIDGLSESEHSPNTEVIVLAGRSGVQKGRLGQSHVSTNIGGWRNDVTQIILDKPLRIGDSGSWVIVDNQVYGFVVSGNKYWSHMVSMPTVLQEISELFGLRMEDISLWTESTFIARKANSQVLGLVDRGTATTAPAETSITSPPSISNQGVGSASDIRTGDSQTSSGIPGAPYLQVTSSENTTIQSRHQNTPTDVRNVPAMSFPPLSSSPPQSLYRLLTARSQDPEHDGGSGAAINRSHGAVNFETPYKQRLGKTTILCLLLNSTIGSEIFVAPALVLKGSGSVGASLLLWAAGTVIGTAGSLVWLEMGLSLPRLLTPDLNKRFVPRNGGEKNYLEYIFARAPLPITSMFGTVFILLSNLSSNAIAFGMYVMTAAGHDEMPKGSVIGLAIGAVTLACFLHIASRRAGILFNNLLACLKALLLVAIVWMGIARAAGANFGSRAHTDTAPTQNLSPDQSFHGDKMTVNGSLASFASCLLLIVNSNSGFRAPFYVSCPEKVLGEVRSPRKWLPKYSLIGMLIPLLVNIAFFLVVPKDQLLKEDAEDFFKFQHLDITTLFFRELFGVEKAPKAISALIAVSIFGNMVATAFTACRVKQEIAKEGILPQSLFFATGYTTLAARLTTAWKSRRPVETTLEQTPMAALGLHWIASILLIASTSMLNPKTAWYVLVSLYSYIIIILIGFVVSGGLLSLYLTPNCGWLDKTQFKPFKYPLHALTQAFACGFLLFAAFLTPNPDSPFAKKVTGFASRIIPAIGITSVLWGIIWWCGLYLVGWRTGKQLIVTRNPVIVPDEDDPTQWVQRAEMVTHTYQEKVDLSLRQRLGVFGRRRSGNATGRGF